MSINELLPGFIEHLEKERHLSPQTQRAYRTDLEQFAVIVSKPFGALTITDLRGYMHTMNDNGLSVRTVKRKLNALSTFYEYLILLGMTNENIARRAARLTPRARKQVVKDYLSTEELKRLVETPAASERDGIAWSLMAWCGMRPGELRSIRVQDVKLAQSVIVIAKGKHDQERAIPIPTELQERIARFTQQRTGTEYLFEGNQGGLWTRDSFKAAFAQHLKACGLEHRGITPKWLRHSFITHMIAAGVNPPIVSKIAGHANIRSMEPYLHYSPDMGAAALAHHPLAKV